MYVDLILLDIRYFDVIFVKDWLTIRDVYSRSKLACVINNRNEGLKWSKIPIFQAMSLKRSKQLADDISITQINM